MQPSSVGMVADGADPADVAEPIVLSVLIGAVVLRLHTGARLSGPRIRAGTVDGSQTPIPPGSAIDAVGQSAEASAARSRN